jgi:hypothetical protein
MEPGLVHSFTNLDVGACGCACVGQNRHVAVENGLACTHPPREGETTMATGAERVIASKLRQRFTELANCNQGDNGIVGEIAFALPPYSLQLRITLSKKAEISGCDPLLGVHPFRPSQAPRMCF